MMRCAVCTGSFDPPTVGHMDIIKRTAALFDRVYVAVLTNPQKTPAFSAKERCELIAKAVAAEGLANVFAEEYSGLTVEFARKKGASAIVRGLRDADDFTYELRLEGANRYLDEGVETIYLAALPEHAFISSSAVKEIASYKKDIDGLVPDAINQKIAERLIKR